MITGKLAKIKNLEPGQLVTMTKGKHKGLVMEFVSITDDTKNSKTHGIVTLKQPGVESDFVIEGDFRNICFEELDECEITLKKSYFK